MTVFIVDEDGLRVDEIARRVYGTERGGNTEAILDTNPGLAGEGPTLPLGRAVVLPERSAIAKAPVPTVNVWD